MLKHVLGRAIAFGAKLRIAVIPSELTQVSAIPGTKARDLVLQQRALLKHKIPHCRDMLCSCAPDPFGMTDWLEASDRCDSPTFFLADLRSQVMV